MPKKLKKKLKTEAIKKGFKPGSKRYNAYVFGTMEKIKKSNDSK